MLGRVQAFCGAFESRVRALGGIGFFLGGIGPDGHVAFNQEGGPLDRYVVFQSHDTFSMSVKGRIYLNDKS